MLYKCLLCDRFSRNPDDEESWFSQVALGTVASIEKAICPACQRNIEDSGTKKNQIPATLQAIRNLQTS